MPTTPPKMHLVECLECGEGLDPNRPWQRFCSAGCRNQYHNRKRRAETESPPSVGRTEAAGGIIQNSEQHSAANLAYKNSQHKYRRILAHLARGNSLNRFEAERLGDHCLNSTISRLGSYGITIARTEETIPGFNGHATRCNRYWLEASEREKAAVILGWRTNVTPPS